MTMPRVTPSPTVTRIPAERDKRYAARYGMEGARYMVGRERGSAAGEMQCACIQGGGGRSTRKAW